jgi:Na+/H+ antiporter NhaD/arsenite permease-like protein
MRPELISIVVLIAIFVLATVRALNLGALGFVAAFMVGTIVLDLPAEELVTGFPAAIFVILVGLTYLFGIAQSNGTLDRLVHWCTRLVGGRTAAMPWIFFCMAAALMGIGAVFCVAIVAPLAMSCARRHNINPLMMGMLVVHGALSTAFSPISVYGSFVNGVVSQTGIPGNAALLFLMPLALNVAIALVVYLALPNGRAKATDLTRIQGASLQAGSHAVGTDADNRPEISRSTTAVAEQVATPAPTRPDRITAEQMGTLAGLVVLAVGSVVFDLDVGFLALSIGTLITVAYPQRTNDALAKVNWSTVFLICGVLTYVGVLEQAGTIDYSSGKIVAIGIPTIAALLLCYLGGITSAFASSIGILAVVIPLSVPFLQEGNVSAIGMVTALAFAATVVDVSPFSTNGALILANTSEEVRPVLYRQMLTYSAIIVATAPAVAWLVLVQSGWF